MHILHRKAYQKPIRKHLWNSHQFLWSLIDCRKITCEIAAVYRRWDILDCRFWFSMLTSIPGTNSEAIRLEWNSFPVLFMLNIWYLLICFGLILKDRINKLRSNAWIEGPGRYREVGDSQMKNSVLIAPLTFFMVICYDKRRKSSRMLDWRVLKFEHTKRWTFWSYIFWSGWIIWSFLTTFLFFMPHAHTMYVIFQLSRYVTYFKVWCM